MYFFGIQPQTVYTKIQGEGQQRTETILTRRQERLNTTSQCYIHKAKPVHFAVCAKYNLHS